MIRIQRGPEPQALCAEREWRLARALIDWHARAGRPWTDEERRRRFRAGYRVASAALVDAQNGKCAYCEIQINDDEDVEHFRPVNLYWWLAWTWENHFAVCGSCSHQKGPGFPLADDARRLLARGLPALPDGLYGDESPRWVDPAIEDPRQFIGFRLFDRGAGLRWEAIGLDGDDGRGESTILDFELYKRMDRQNRRFLGPMEDPALDLAQVRAAARRGQIAERAWARVIRRHLRAPGAPHRALAYDYLTHVRAELRRAHGVELPPLPDITDARPVPAPAPLFTRDPVLDRLDPVDALYARSARAPKVPAAHRERALIAVLALGERSRRQLSAVFGKTTARIHAWLGPLVPDRVESEGRGPATIYRLVQQPPPSSTPAPVDVPGTLDQTAGGS